MLESVVPETRKEGHACRTATHPPEFRRKVLDLVAAGRSVASIAADLGVSDQTAHTWPKQELVDAGEVPGLTTFEAAELRVTPGM